jgi:hypothetical protein
MRGKKAKKGTGQQIRYYYINFTRGNLALIFLVSYYCLLLKYITTEIYTEFEILVTVLFHN